MRPFTSGQTKQEYHLQMERLYAEKVPMNEVLSPLAIFYLQDQARREGVVLDPQEIERKINFVMVPGTVFEQMTPQIKDTPSPAAFVVREKKVKGKAKVAVDALLGPEPYGKPYGVMFNKSTLVRNDVVLNRDVREVLAIHEVWHLIQHWKGVGHATSNLPFETYTKDENERAAYRIEMEYCENYLNWSWERYMFETRGSAWRKTVPARWQIFLFEMWKSVPIPGLDHPTPRNRDGHVSRSAPRAWHPGHRCSKNAPSSSSNNRRAISFCPPIPASSLKTATGAGPDAIWLGLRQRLRPDRRQCHRLLYAPARPFLPRRHAPDHRHLSPRTSRLLPLASSPDDASSVGHPGNGKHAWQRCQCVTLAVERFPTTLAREYLESPLQPSASNQFGRNTTTRTRYCGCKIRWQLRKKPQVLTRADPYELRSRLNR